MDKLRAVLVVLGAAGLVLLPAATASHTPDPLAVTIAGSLQSEAGCPGDWDPACAATHLAYDANDDVWQGTFALPAGSYEYKAALNDAWDENYGLHAQSNGANIPLDLAVGRRASSSTTTTRRHWVTDNRSSVIAVAAGSFQSELGCPGDWDPELPALVARGPRRRRHLHLRDDRAAGRLVRDEGRDQRGLGRELRRRAASRTARTSRSPSRSTTRRSRSRYDATSHVLTITRDADRRTGRPGALSHFDLARKDCLGTARNTTSKVWYTVANGVLSDVYYPTIDNTNVETLQYVVTDGSTFTDLQTRDMTYTVEAIPDSGRHGLQGHGDGEERQVHDRDRVPHRPGRNTVLMRVTFKPKQRRATGSTCASTRP